MEHQGQAFKLRIVTLEASVKDLKQTIGDLKVDIDRKEQQLRAQGVVLHSSQDRERTLMRNVAEAQDEVAQKGTLILRLETKLEEARNELAHHQAAWQVFLEFQHLSVWCSLCCNDNQHNVHRMRPALKKQHLMCCLLNLALRKKS